MVQAVPMFASKYDANMGHRADNFHLDLGTFQDQRIPPRQGGAIRRSWEQSSIERLSNRVELIATRGLDPLPV